MFTYRCAAHASTRAPRLGLTRSIKPSCCVSIFFFRTFLLLEVQVGIRVTWKRVRGPPVSAYLGKPKPSHLSRYLRTLSRAVTSGCWQANVS